MQEPTNLTKLNAAVLEAMQRLAELRAERIIPQAAEGPLNEALRKLGEAFALSRRQSPEPPTQELTNQRLSRIFLENEKFFAATLGNHDLDLLSQDSGPAITVPAAAGQLEFVILNLLLAYQKIAGGPRPIGITLDIVEASEEVAGSLPIQGGTRYARISVHCREGNPIPFDKSCDKFLIHDEREAEHIYTGLSSALRVVETRGGCLLARHRSDTPALALLMPSVESTEPVILPEDEQAQHDETVLIVDDDHMVRRYTRHALESSGFSVLEASDSKEAMSKLRDAEGAVDILVADLVLPDMHGGMLARSIQEEFGKLPVVFVSGYDDKAIQHHGLIDHGATLLHKPYTRKSLLNKIEAILNAES